MASPLEPTRFRVIWFQRLEDLCLLVQDAINACAEPHSGLGGPDPTEAEELLPAVIITKLTRRHELQAAEGDQDDKEAFRIERIRLHTCSPN
jgi:hypothetical protein